MLAAILRNTLLVAALAVGALLLSLARGSMVSASGVPGPALVNAVAPISATLLLAGLLLPVLGVAILVGRVFNAAVALFVLGAAISVLSMQCGTIEDLALGGGALGPLAIESGLWAVATLGMVLVVFAGSGALPDLPRERSSWFAELADRGSGVHLLTVILALGAVWLVVQTPMKGQAIGGAVVAGIAVGFAGRLLAPRTQPLVLFAVPALAGCIGMAIASMALGTAPPSQAFVAGTLSRLGFPMPLDWVGGGLCGVSIGLGWSRGFVRSTPDEVSAGGEIDVSRRVVRG